MTMLQIADDMPPQLRKLVDLLHSVAEASKLIEVGAVDLDDGEGCLLGLIYRHPQQLADALGIAMATAQRLEDPELIDALKGLGIGIGKPMKDGRTMGVFPSIRLRGERMGEA